MDTDTAQKFADLHRLTAENGWLRSSEKAGIRVDYKPIAGSNFRIIRATCVISTTPASAADCVWSIPSLKSLDKSLDTFKVLEDLTSTARICYQLVKPGLGVAPREFVYFQTRTTVDDNHYLLTYSVQSELAPEVKNHIRAEIDVCGFIFTPGVNCTHVTYIVKSELRGSIPAWIINYFAESNIIAVVRYLKATYN